MGDSASGGDRRRLHARVLAPNCRRRGCGNHCSIAGCSLGVDVDVEHSVVAAAVGQGAGDGVVAGLAAGHGAAVGVATGEGVVCGRGRE